jgi:hypothetical protein
MEDLRYPVGKFAPPAAYTLETRQACIAEIAGLPGAVRVATEGLIPGQLLVPYREGGWSVAQVVHHLADSHMNAYVRFKLAVTKDNPRVEGYPEAVWATQADAADADITTSLAVLDGLHARWARFLANLEPDTFARTFQHSEYGPATLDRSLALYAWHGRHHVAHITGLRDRMGWK